MADEWYVVADAARLLGVSAHTVRRWVGSRLSGTRVGSPIRLAAPSVERERARILADLEAVDARKAMWQHSEVDHLEMTRLRARVAELEELGRALAEMQELALRAISQRLVGDTLND